MNDANPWAAWLAQFDTVDYQLGRKAGWDAFVNAAPRPRFEVLSRAQLAALDEDVRDDYDEARRVWNTNPPTIKTQQLTQAFEVLDQVMASARRDGGQAARLGGDRRRAWPGQDHDRDQVRPPGPSPRVPPARPLHA